MSTPDLLDQATQAMRLEHEDGPGDDADGTRWRIRASMESARVARGRLLGALVVVGVLGTGGVSWAYLSGRLEGVWPWLVNMVGAERITEETPAKDGATRKAQPKVASRQPRSSEQTAEQEIGAIGASAPPVELAAAPPPALPAPLAPVPVEPARISPPARTVKQRVAAVRPAPPELAAPPAVVAPPPATPSVSASSIERAAEPALPAAAPDLYRVAHQLHFHGSDQLAALAAWDKYLASESSGRFAIEARYNRAMTLIKLRRYREALLALQPFAAGEIMPAGYRQSEAKRLSERLSRALAAATDEPK